MQHNHLESWSDSPDQLGLAVAELDTSRELFTNSVMHYSTGHARAAEAEKRLIDAGVSYGLYFSAAAIAIADDDETPDWHKAPSLCGLLSDDRSRLYDYFPEALKDLPSIVTPPSPYDELDRINELLATYKLSKDQEAFANAIAHENQTMAALIVKQAAENTRISWQRAALIVGHVVLKQAPKIGLVVTSAALAYRFGKTKNR